jgi:hypothetical protein
MSGLPMSSRLGGKRLSLLAVRRRNWQIRKKRDEYFGLIRESKK